VCYIVDFESVLIGKLDNKALNEMKNNQRICELMWKNEGVDISKFKSSFLKSSIQKRMRETQSDRSENYESLFENNSEEKQQLLESLQISYSEFFRNPLTFAVLDKIIIPSLYSKKDKQNLHEVRIWSAACAGGQETYSLSILLNEFNTRIKLDYRIFATDQSEVEIAKAKAGVYSLLAMNQLKLKTIDDWFVKQDDLYHARQELKRNIDFSCFDLLDEQHSCPPASIFGNFDIIFCANVLFYYKEEHSKKIIAKLRHCLAENGLLITGEVERDLILSQQFEEVYPQSAIFRKI
jgi:chemotaxis protein methyltransferase CheR